MYVYNLYYLKSYSQSTDGKCVIPDCTDDKTWINGNDTRAFEVDNTAAVYFMDVPAFNTTAGKLCPH